MYSQGVYQTLASIKVIKPITVVYDKYYSLQQQPGFTDLLFHVAVALPFGNTEFPGYRLFTALYFLSLFFLIVEPADRIVREPDASAKGRLDWVGGGDQDK